jgi:hypothetical protein
VEELLNCVMEICCVTKEEAQASLLKMFKLDHCKTPEDCAKMIFEYFTLAPRSFVEVKKEIARLAKS